MFISRPKPTVASIGPMKQYATRGENIPLEKDWLNTWCTLPQAFDTVLEEILQYEIREDDVFVVTFMKCGTTWMQETAWLLMNNLDFEKCKSEHILDRSIFIENHGVIKGAPNGVELSHKVPSPRLIKSHMPASLLPLQVWQRKQKIIYVARNCKDALISSYHFVKSLKFWLGETLEEYVNDFINSEVNYSSYWTHTVDFWRMRNEPNIFFVTYEEMKSNLQGVIERLCTFLERPQLTQDEMKKMLDHLSFDSMKKNDKTNLTLNLKDCISNVANDFQFMRRGIVGSFKDELTPELQMKIDNWSKAFLAQYDITEEDIFGTI